MIIVHEAPPRPPRESIGGEPEAKSAVNPMTQVYANPANKPFFINAPDVDLTWRPNGKEFWASSNIATQNQNKNLIVFEASNGEVIKTDGLTKRVVFDVGCIRALIAGLIAESSAERWQAENVERLKAEADAKAVAKAEAEAAEAKADALHERLPISRLFAN